MTSVIIILQFQSRAPTDNQRTETVPHSVQVSVSRATVRLSWHNRDIVVSPSWRFIYVTAVLSEYGFNGTLRQKRFANVPTVVFEYVHGITLSYVSTTGRPWCPKQAIEVYYTIEICLIDIPDDSAGSHRRHHAKKLIISTVLVCHTSTNVCYSMLYLYYIIFFSITVRFVSSIEFCYIQ